MELVKIFDSKFNSYKNYSKLTIANPKLVVGHIEYQNKIILN